jgi:AraC-like DNA-binding protein
MSNSLSAALARKHATGRPGGRSSQPLVSRGGLSVSDILCTSGPRDATFEETHSVASIAVVLSGTFTYRGPHGRVLMTPGSLLMGNARHCFTCGHDHGEGDRCLAFMFDDELFERIAADTGVRSTHIPAHRMPFLRATAPVIADATAAMGDAVALEEVAMSLAQTVLLAHHDARAPKVVARDERRVTEIVRYLEGSFERSHAVLDLARRARLSPFHFLRVFRQVTGVSPHQMLLRLRLNAAALKLRTTQEPVTDIAYAVGFEDLSNFIRSFRAEFGRAPSRYRPGER